MNPGRVKAPKRLLIRPGAIGDFVASLPALQFLKSTYTEIWCAEQNVPLTGFADRAISIGASGLHRVGVLPAQEVFEKLRNFDQIFSWYGTGNEDFRTAVKDLPFRFFTAVPPAGTTFNATRFFCQQVGAPDGIPCIETGAQARQNFVILHPFASSPSKRWPLDNFQRLAAMLPHTCWCAGPDEPLPNAVRISSLMELARWIATARAYVGNDSGITHLAAVVGTPVVAIFGSSDPAIWAPRGPHVRVLSRIPIDSISPEEVFAAIASLV